MARPTVVDYSWAKPDPACLRASGYVGVMRYLSWDASKNLTRAEAETLHAHGLWVGLNWEGHGNWTEFSGDGAAAGREAKRQCDLLGAPASVPVFVSADYGAPAAHWPTIERFLHAFTGGSGREVGFYGQGNLADWLRQRGTIRWIWQTNATGWGGVSTAAILRQQIWTTVCGASVDPNILQGNPADWAWMPNQPVEDDMTPDQAKQLAQAARDAATAADQAPKAALYAAGANAKADQALSWSVAAALEGIYQTRLGRSVDAAGIKAWSEHASKGATWSQIDAAIAASPEGVKYAAKPVV